MRIELERFLVTTALIASGAMLGSGCTVEDSKSNSDAGITGGFGGFTGGSGGSGGSVGGSGGSVGGSGGTAGGSGGTAGGAAGSGGTAGGAAGSGGTAGGAAGSGGTAGGAAGSGGTAGGAAGSGGTAGGAAGAAGSGATAGAAGAGGACLGDGDADAGFEGIDCSTLSYYTDDCADAGYEWPLGVDLCSWADANLRPEVANAMLACLGAINVSDNCSSAHDAAVQNCLDTVIPQACTKPLIDDGDGGLYDPCTDVTSFCSAVPMSQCDNTLDAVTNASEVAILTCWNNSNGTSCSDDWDSCVGLP
jgi:hypothetical protein